MISITIVRDRYTKSWPTHEDAPVAYVLPIGRALSRSYSSDAHMVQYVSPVGHRLSSDAIGRVEVRIAAVIFDVDCHDVHGSGDPAPQVWRCEQYVRFTELIEAHPGGFLYFTRGGYRIVYTHGTPTELRTKDDARQWSCEYAVAVAYLERRFGIVADPACADWTRLFRLPHATRDKGGKPEAWPVFGDPDRIGALLIKPADEDVETAYRNSRAFREPRSAHYEPYTGGDGRGVLFHALQGRGDIIRRRGDTFVVRCPNESAHSSGRTGDGSTILYTPAYGQELGWVKCLHAHCVNLDARDWLRLFDDHEIESARNAAGFSRGSAA